MCLHFTDGNQGSDGLNDAAETTQLVVAGLGLIPGLSDFTTSKSKLSKASFFIT